MSVVFKGKGYEISFSNNDNKIVGSEILRAIIPDNMITDGLTDKFATFISSKKEASNNVCVQECDVLNWLQTQPIVNTCSLN